VIRQDQPIVSLGNGWLALPTLGRRRVPMMARIKRSQRNGELASADQQVGARSIKKWSHSILVT